MSRDISIDAFARIDLRAGRIVAIRPLAGEAGYQTVLVDVGEPVPRSVGTDELERFGRHDLAVGQSVIVASNVRTGGRVGVLVIVAGALASVASPPGTRVR